MTTKEVTVRPDQAIVAVGNRIDEIIKECLPVAAQESQNFAQALVLAGGVKELRQIILTDKNIRNTVESMQNTHLGFMTDRTDLAIWKSKQGSGKELKPYRYEEVAEVCIEAMLSGYRITNNEFNMIAGRFYAAKNGKFRRIQEAEGVTDFQFTTTSPAYEAERGGVQYAKVQAFASWKKDGVLTTLGSSTGAEDKLVFKIRVNKFMGEDAIVGKALSKLFSRVLLRLEGKITPESTDVSEGDVVDAEWEAPDLTENLKNGKEGTAEALYGPKGKQPDTDIQTEVGRHENEQTKAAKAKLGDADRILFEQLTNEDANVFWRRKAKAPLRALVEPWLKAGLDKWSPGLIEFVQRKCDNLNLNITFALEPDPANTSPNGKQLSSSTDPSSPNNSGSGEHIFCPDGGKFTGKHERPVSPLVDCSGCDKNQHCDPYAEYVKTEKGAGAGEALE